MTTSTTKYEHKRLLYFVQHQNQEMIKIGIATDNGRFHQLNQDYVIDWTKSLYFEGEDRDVQLLEKILHRLFHKNRLEQQNGTGGTEWFEATIKEKLVDSVIFNVRNSDFEIDLNFKEIDLEQPKESLEEPKEKKEKLETKTKENRKDQKSIFEKYPDKIVRRWRELNSIPNEKITFEDVDEMNRLIPEMTVILKPSELTQVVFMKDGKLFKMHNTHTDLVNIIYYESNKYIKKNKIKIDEEAPSTFVEIYLQDFASSMDKYKHGQYDFLIGCLRDLSSIEIVINSLGKNKEMEELIITRFVQEIRFNRAKHKKNKKVKLAVPNIILLRITALKKYFTRMFFEIQFSLNSKYSKFLYEILKDYEGVDKKIIDLFELMDLINVTSNTQKQWKFFRPNILEKAIKEINEKSDIKVSYEPIKEKTEENPRLHVEKILFQIEPQPESRLKKLGLLDHEDLSIEEQIHMNKMKSIAKQKLDKILNSPYGQKIEDPDKWIEKDIKQFKDKYDSMVKLDDWYRTLMNIDDQERRKYYSELTDYIGQGKMIIFDKDNYQLKDLMDPSIIISFDPTKTYEILKSFHDNED